jgi:hypothetical protein
VSDDVTGEFAEFLYDLLPKNAHKHVPAIVAEHVSWLEVPISEAEVVGAHIAVNEQRIGDWTIGTDAAGNAVSVDFGEDTVTAM